MKIVAEFFRKNTWKINWYVYISLIQVMNKNQLEK